MTQRMRDDEPTWDLARFRAAYAEDDNHWWVIGCGHHQNLFEAACDALDAAPAAVLRSAADVLSEGGDRRAAQVLERLANEHAVAGPVGVAPQTPKRVETKATED